MTGDGRQEESIPDTGLAGLEQRVLSQKVLWGKKPNCPEPLLGMDSARLSPHGIFSEPIPSQQSIVKFSFDKIFKTSKTFANLIFGEKYE